MTFDEDPLQDDEEETIVYVEFENVSGTDAFLNDKLQLDMIGLDTEHPIMRINGRHYEGTYEDAVGTCLFFDKDNPKIEDPVFDKIPNIRYHTKTKKILKMKRVFVKPRLEVLGDSNCSNCIPNIETIKEAGVPPKYQQDALLLWEKIRKERLEARNDYLEKQKQRKEKRQRGIEPDSDSDEDNPFIMYKNKSHDDKCSQSQEDTANDHNQESSIEKLCKSHDLRVSLERIDPKSMLKNKSIIESSEKNVTHDTEISKQTSVNQDSISKVNKTDNKKSKSSGVKKNIPDFEIASTSSMTAVNDKTPENKTIKLDNVIVEQNDNVETSKASPSTNVNDKTRSKQQKRAAKMQEISERFRKSACLMKLQTDKANKS